MDRKCLDFTNRKSLPVSYKKDAKNSRKLTEFMLIFILSYKFGSDRIEALNTKGEDIMKYLKEVTIIFGITMLGEFLNYLLPFPVPSGVYGLFILLLLLCTGALHTEDVAEVGDFFLDTMPIMFIPAGVGLMASWGVLKPVLVPVSIITVVCVFTVMGVSGVVTQFLIKIKKNR